MIAMIPSDLCELRQDPALLGSGRGTVSRRHGLQKFISRTHADPPRACLPSQSAQGTFLVRQHTIFTNNSGAAMRFSPGLSHYRWQKSRRNRLYAHPNRPHERRQSRSLAHLGPRAYRPSQDQPHQRARPLELDPAIGVKGCVARRILLKRWLCHWSVLRTAGRRSALIKFFQRLPQLPISTAQSTQE